MLASKKTPEFRSLCFNSEPFRSFISTRKFFKTFSMGDDSFLSSVDSKVFKSFETISFNDVEELLVFFRFDSKNVVNSVSFCFNSEPFNT